MIHQCYYCDRLFDTIEKLYDHLDVHAKTKAEQEEDKIKEKTGNISSMKKSIETIDIGASPERAKRKKREDTSRNDQTFTKKQLLGSRRI